MSAYGTSPVKRTRRTRSEIKSLDAALMEIVAQFSPVTVRQIFYQAVNRSLVPKSETKGYRVVQRRLVVLRESGKIPYGELVRNAIDSHMDPWRLEQFRMVEREERETLRSMFGGAA